LTISESNSRNAIAINGRGRPALPTIAINFDHEHTRYRATFSRHPDGKVAEIYLLDGGGAASHTAARLASLCLSAGVGLVDIRRACIGGPMAEVLDRIIALGPNQENKKANDDGDFSRCSDA
jgi:hypothetical protein